MVENNLDFDKTMLFDVSDVRDEQVKRVLYHVDAALEEKGYNSINQIVGYLISNDPAYISSYKDARKLLQSIDRNDIIEELVKAYLGK
jgi:uncharacterized protein (UPF0297 family)